MTIEDETGGGNIIIRRRVQERFTVAVMEGMFVVARGKTQHADNVIHLLLEEIYDFSEGTNYGLDVDSRDFH